MNAHILSKNVVHARFIDQRLNSGFKTASHSMDRDVKPLPSEERHSRLYQILHSHHLEELNHAVARPILENKLLQNLTNLNGLHSSKTNSLYNLTEKSKSLTIFHESYAAFFHEPKEIKE